MKSVFYLLVKRFSRRRRMTAYIAGAFSLARGYYPVRAAEFEPVPGQPVS
jgi:hypothetical protein